MKRVNGIFCVAALCLAVLGSLLWGVWYQPKFEGGTMTMPVKIFAGSQPFEKIWERPCALGRFALSPDGKMLAVQTRNAVWLADFRTGKWLRELPVDFQSMEGACLLFSPDGTQLAVCGTGAPIQLFDAASGKKRCVFKNPDASTELQAIRFSPDGRCFAAAPNPFAISVCETATGKTLRERLLPFLLSSQDSQLPQKIFEQFSDFDFSSDGRQLVISLGDRLEFLDSQSLRCQKKLRFLESCANSLRCLPDGKSLFFEDLTEEEGSGFRILNLFREESRQAIQFQESDLSGVQTWNWELGASASGARLFLQTPNGAIHVFDLKTGQELRVLEFDASEMICRLACSPDASRIAVLRTDGRITVWNAESGTCLFSGWMNEKKAAPEDGAETDAFTTSAFFPAGLAFSPDGQRLFAADPSQKTIEILNAQSGVSLRALPENFDGTFHSMNCSPDGKFLIVSSSFRVTAWSLK